MISLTLVDVRKPAFLRINALKNQLKELIQLEHKKVGDISIVLTSDSYLLKVNQEFLNHDFFTDIITFDYCDGDLISGDLMQQVVYCLVMKKQPKHNNKKLKN